MTFHGLDNFRQGDMLGGLGRQIGIDYNEAPSSLAMKVAESALPETASGFGTSLKSIFNRFQTLRAKEVRHNRGRYASMLNLTILNGSK